MKHQPLKFTLTSRLAAVTVVAALIGAAPSNAQVGITESVVGNANVGNTVTTTTGTGVSVTPTRILPNGTVVRSGTTTSVNQPTGGTMTVNGAVEPTTTTDANGRQHRNARSLTTDSTVGVNGTTTNGTVTGVTRGVNNLSTTNSAGVSTSSSTSTNIAGVSPGSATSSTGGSASVSTGAKAGASAGGASSAGISGGK